MACKERRRARITGLRAEGRINLYSDLIFTLKAYTAVIHCGDCFRGRNRQILRVCPSLGACVGLDKYIFFGCVVSAWVVVLVFSVLFVCDMRVGFLIFYVLRFCGIFVIDLGSLKICTRMAEFSAIFIYWWLNDFFTNLLLTGKFDII